MSLGFFGKRRPGKADVFRTKVERIGDRHALQRSDVIALGASFLLIVAMLVDPERLYNSVEPMNQHFGTNELATEEWRAEFAFEAPDLRATERARDESAARVLNIYTIDPLTYRARMAEFDGLIEAIRSHRDEARKAIDSALASSQSTDDAMAVARAAAVAFAQARVGKEPFTSWEDPAILGILFTPTPASLPQRKFAPVAEGSDPDAPRRTEAIEYAEGRQLAFGGEGLITQWARESLDIALNTGIIDPQSDVIADPDQKVRVVRRRTLGTLSSFEDIAVGRILDPTGARESLRVRLRERLDAAALTAVLPDIDGALALEAAYNLAAGYIEPNLRLNEGDTLSAKRTARANVEPVLKTIDRGEIIQADGERWTDQSVSDAEVYLEKKRIGSEPIIGFVMSLMSHTLITVLLLLAVVKSLPVLLRRNEQFGKVLRVSLLLITGMMVVGRVVSYFEPTGFVVPAAALAILLAILSNARVASMAAIVFAVLLSVQYDYDWRVYAVASIMGCAGAMSITKVRRRSDMARACFQASGAGLCGALAIILAFGSIEWDMVSRTFMLIALNGALCLFIVPGVLPPLERLLGIITDIQLLEYSDLNNEILSRLAIEVPATYAHSLALGQLAEGACEAIGANGLLARVSAYYHDIGKIRRPEYFIENQTGQNVHDGLSPRLSARAIASHVTEGAEMAHELHLPKPLIDAINEHHGTCLISFFYQFAKDQSKHDDVREEDYRYPGPKPQSRETAILMICDAVESGVRSIKNPNEERVREFVDKIILSRSKDRQFDSCDLTLRDLDTIAEVVTQRMVSTQHTRIAYPPQPSGGDSADNVVPLSSGAE